MLSWYDSIKNEIDACPTSTRPTCTTFESKNTPCTLSTRTTCTTFHENVGRVGHVDKGESAKQVFQTKYTATYFSTNDQGRPGFCIHCSAWTQGKGVWWSGACLHNGERKNNKSRCTLEVWEVA